MWQGLALPQPTGQLCWQRQLANEAVHKARLVLSQRRAADESGADRQHTHGLAMCTSSLWLSRHRGGRGGGAQAKAPVPAELADGKVVVDQLQLSQAHDRQASDFLAGHAMDVHWLGLRVNEQLRHSVASHGAQTAPDAQGQPRTTACTAQRARQRTSRARHTMALVTGFFSL